LRQFIKVGLAHELAYLGNPSVVGCGPDGIGVFLLLDGHAPELINIKLDIVCTDPLLFKENRLTKKDWNAIVFLIVNPMKSLKCRELARI
jgi:hypothetical protein